MVMAPQYSVEMNHDLLQSILQSQRALMRCSPLYSVGPTNTNAELKTDILTQSLLTFYFRLHEVGKGGVCVFILTVISLRAQHQPKKKKQRPAHKS